MTSGGTPNRSQIDSTISSQLHLKIRLPPLDERNSIKCVHGKEVQGLRKVEGKFSVANMDVTSLLNSNAAAAAIAAAEKQVKMESTRSTPSRSRTPWDAG